MDLDYTQIGKRIAKRRRKLKLKQAEVSERADISPTYMSNIERGISIPSTEVVMRLAVALDTTPDEFLVGTSRAPGEEWKFAAHYVQGMSGKKLELAKGFLQWLSEQDI